MWKIRLGGALDLSFVVLWGRGSSSPSAEDLSHGLQCRTPSGTARCEVSALPFLDSCCMVNTFLALILHQPKDSFVDVIYYSQFTEIILRC